MAQEKPVKEVFFSDYLQKKAKKSLVACVAWAGIALTLLLTGIAAGVAVILVSGVVAVMVALFVAATRGPVYTTYRCGIRGEQVLRAHLLSSGLGDEYTAYYNLPLNGNGEGLRHRLRPRRSLRAFRLRSKAPSRPHSLPERNLGADQGGPKGNSLSGSARRPLRSTIPQYQKAQGTARAHRRPLASRRRRLHEPAGRPRHRGTPMGQGHSREGPGADPFRKNDPFRRADRQHQRPPHRFRQEVIWE